MIATGDSARHEEAWLALPWLANGRLSQAERDKIEPHVRECAACRVELAFQRLLCNALTEPDRVTYAPGPSFRKLMDRIDGTGPPAVEGRERAKTIVRNLEDRIRGGSPEERASPKERATPKESARPSRNRSLWRPPGLAWAASFVLMVGLTGIISTMYRSSQPLYTTHTDATHAASNVVHIAFDRSVTIGEAEEVLRSAGARIVEGPDGTGIFGVTPGVRDPEKMSPGRANHEIRVLSARLRADPRIRWVEPIPADDNSPDDDTAMAARGP
jgi:hypothetical protein